MMLFLYCTTNCGYFEDDRRFGVKENKKSNVFIHGTLSSTFGHVAILIYIAGTKCMNSAGVTTSDCHRKTRPRPHLDCVLTHHMSSVAVADRVVLGNSPESHLTEWPRLWDRLALLPSFLISALLD